MASLVFALVLTIGITPGVFASEQNTQIVNSAMYLNTDNIANERDEEKFVKSQTDRINVLLQRQMELESITDKNQQTEIETEESEISDELDQIQSQLKSLYALTPEQQKLFQHHHPMI